jgi:hypothetical protein
LIPDSFQDDASSGLSDAELAAAYNVTERTIRTWRRVTHTRKSDIQGIVNGRVETDCVKQRTKADITETKQQYEAALRQINLQERLVEALERSLVTLPVVTVADLPSSGPCKGSILEAVAPASDWHMGEVVTFADTGGIAQYNPTVFNRRVYLWVERIKLLVGIRRQVDTIDTLHVPFLGDITSGSIHNEFVRTNTQTDMMLSVNAAYVFAQALISLASDFQQIKVTGVIGNHGRQTMKPETKLATQLNWDYMTYQMIAFFCRNQPNISFEFSEAFFQVLTVAKRNILISHGAGIKMHYKTPHYGIMTFVDRMRAVLAVQHKTFDDVMLGHFHVDEVYSIPTGHVYISGSGKGGDEYALTKLHTYAPPTQTLFFYKQRKPARDVQLIDIEDADRCPTYGFKMGLPKLWSTADVL